MRRKPLYWTLEPWECILNVIHGDFMHVKTFVECDLLQKQKQSLYFTLGQTIDWIWQIALKNIMSLALFIYVSWLPIRIHPYISTTPHSVGQCLIELRLDQIDALSYMYTRHTAFSRSRDDLSLWWYDKMWFLNSDYCRDPISVENPRNPRRDISRTWPPEPIDQCVQSNQQNPPIHPFSQTERRRSSNVVIRVKGSVQFDLIQNCRPSIHYFAYMMIKILIWSNPHPLVRLQRLSLTRMQYRSTRLIDRWRFLGLQGCLCRLEIYRQCACCLSSWASCCMGTVLLD